jgi:hypothetical protein
MHRPQSLCPFVLCCQIKGGRQNAAATSSYSGIIVVFALLADNKPTESRAQSGPSQPSNASILAEAKAGFEKRYHENLQNVSLSTKWQPSNYALMANFTVKNAGTLPVKDLTIICETYAKSGTKIDTTRTKLYDTFPIGSKTVKNFDMVNLVGCPDDALRLAGHAQWLGSKDAIADAL